MSTKETEPKVWYVSSKPEVYTKLEAYTIAVNICKTHGHSLPTTVEFDDVDEENAACICLECRNLDKWLNSEEVRDYVGDFVRISREKSELERFQGVAKWFENA